MKDIHAVLGGKQLNVMRDDDGIFKAALTTADVQEIHAFLGGVPILEKGTLCTTSAAYQGCANSDYPGVQQGLQGNRLRFEGGTTRRVAGRPYGDRLVGSGRNANTLESEFVGVGRAEGSALGRLCEGLRDQTGKEGGCVKQTTPRVFHGVRLSPSGRVGSEPVAGKGKAQCQSTTTPERQLEMDGMHLQRAPATPHQS
ncbi:hypothetical protein B0H14DRAFT_2595527 [Mycena olivaceomarginata]|nr:hypothetical protein B0H14DRAFT_2595527 [Mycena olivaceomarginata]